MAQKRARAYGAPAHGYTLIELLFAIGLAATVAGTAVPQASAALDHMNTLGAARYVSARLQHARMDAVRRHANTAMRFIVSGTAVHYRVYVDGNRNGVRSADILSGLDRPLGATEQLSDQFGGVVFGALPGLPPVDPGGIPPGSDPVRFGSSDMVTFTAAGTSTPGSLYIRGRGTAQYVIRVFGDTGKTRILKFRPASRTWSPL